MASASSTPSPVIAEHDITGTISPAPIPWERPLLNSSSVNSSPEKNFSISSSSVSAIASVSASLSSRVTTEVPNLLLSSSMTSSTFTFSLSVLFMRKNLGILKCLHEFQAFSVPTCTPDEASTTIAAASTALSAEFTSPTKSKNPGVSTKFIFTFLYSTGTSEVLME